MNKTTAAITLITFAGVASIAAAAVSTYADRTAFDLANPTASFEDFEEARVLDGQASAMENVLNAATSNAIFLPGEIVAGLEVRVAEDTNNPGDNMFVSGPGFANYTSHAISFNQPGTDLPQITIAFTNGNAQAVAFDVTSNPNGNTVNIELFNGAVSLGNYAVVGSGGGTFFGAFSDSDVITHATLSNGAYFGIDNVAFAVPAPGAAALLGLGGLFATRRRRN